jgi:hypothetical protein
LEEIHAYKTKTKCFEVRSAVSTAFDVWVFLNGNVISKLAP